jgi:hypothetical protein
VASPTWEKPKYTRKKDSNLFIRLINISSKTLKNTAKQSQARIVAAFTMTLFVSGTLTGYFLTGRYCSHRGKKGKRNITISLSNFVKQYKYSIRISQKNFGFDNNIGMKNKQHITVLLSRFVAAVSACTRCCIRILQYTDMGNMGNTDRETKNGRRFIIPYILFIFCPIKSVSFYALFDLYFQK